MLHLSRELVELLILGYRGLRKKRFLFPFWDGRSVLQLNGGWHAKVTGAPSPNTQARGALGPQRAVNNRELTARPKKEREISFRAIRTRPQLSLFQIYVNKCLRSYTMVSGLYFVGGA